MAPVEERLGLAETSRWLQEELQEVEEAMRRAGDHGHHPPAAFAGRRALRPRRLQPRKLKGGAPS